MILEEAGNLVHGERGKAYDHPFDDFTRVAGLWSVLLEYDVTPLQVALCLGALKMSRLIHNPTHYDSIVDWAGYAETYAMVLEKVTHYRIDVTVDKDD